MIVVCAALVIGSPRLLQMVDGFGQGWETVNIARSLVMDGRFANPFGSETGLTAQQPPAYPILLAGILWALGDTPNANLVAWALSTLFLVAWLALLPVISDRWLQSPIPGLAAALCIICVPVLSLSIVWPDSSAVPLALIAFCLLPWSGWRLGAAAGLLAHLSPSALAIAGAWYLSKRRSAREFLTFAAAFIAVCLPWTVRNYFAVGGIVPMRSTASLELYVGNTGARHPTADASERAVVVELGELAYMRRCQDRAGTWIRKHPAQFAALTIDRIRLFWFGSPPFFILTLLAFMGLWFARRTRFGTFAGLAMLLYPLPFYVASATAFPRYRCPLIWVTALLAGYALASLSSRLISWARRPSGGVAIALETSDVVASPHQALHPAPALHASGDGVDDRRCALHATLPGNPALDAGRNPD